MLASHKTHEIFKGRANEKGVKVCCVVCKDDELFVGIFDRLKGVVELYAKENSYQREKNFL